MNEPGSVEPAALRLLYVTDLHGNERRYRRVIELARDGGFAAVVNGGDMLPKGDDLFRQDRFITGFLDAHWEEFDAAGIACLCFPGNDDLAVFDGLFDEVASRHPAVQDIAGRRTELGGFEFIGMNWVVDYPFRLKDRCRMDTPAYAFQPQFGTGLLSTPGGWRELPDWKRHARGLPTVADELAALPRPADPGRAVYVIHMPPAGLGLDRCWNGVGVGSIAVRDFLLATQPRLALHGHIHESPEVSGVWRGELGRTACVQPGQDRLLTWVEMDLGSVSMERRTEEVRP
jgi:Icc-related predicted phosphoesterase